MGGREIKFKDQHFMTLNTEIGSFHIKQLLSYIGERDLSYHESLFPDSVTNFVFNKDFCG